MATTNRATDDVASRDLESSSEGLGQTVRQVADGVAGVAGEVTARVPEVAQTTRDAFSEANRMVRGGSDETLKVVGAATVGFAVGLLVGGANRLLVMLALIPAALIGTTMIERTEGTTSPTSPAAKSRVQGG